MQTPPRYETMLESIQNLLPFSASLINMIENLYNMQEIEENNEKYCMLFKDIIIEVQHASLSLSKALYIAIKISFDVFLIKAGLLSPKISVENEPVYIYQLLSYADRFETYSPLLDIATKLVSDVYQDNETVLKAKVILLQDRLYTLDSSYIQDNLDKRVQKSFTHSNTRISQLLREKIAIERSCQIKASQILVLQSELNHIQGEFFNCFPAYIKEGYLKLKSHLFLEIQKEIKEKGDFSSDAVEKIANKLCSLAGEHIDLKETAQNARLWNRDIFGEYDLARAEQFTNQFSREIMSLLKIAHPDKWNVQDAPEEMAQIIKKKSNELINIRELSKLGPCIGGTNALLLLKQFKADFAMLHPEILKQDEGGESSSVDIKTEIAMWTTSDSFLTEQLNRLLEDPEINRMREMLEYPEETKEAYRDELMLSIFSLTYGIKQLSAEEKINSAWNAVTKKAMEISLNPEKLKIFLNDLNQLEEE